MPTWKRVLLEGETDNLAGADLTQSDADRYHLIPSPGTLRFSNESSYSAGAADAACLSIDLNSGVNQANESQFRLGQRTDLYTNSFLLGGAGSGGDQILGVKNSATYGNHGYFDGDSFVFNCGKTSESVRIVDDGDNGTSEDPVLILHRESTSPAVNDLLGAIRFNGKVDSTPDYERTFGRISAAIDKNGGNRGVLHFQVMQNGETMGTTEGTNNPTLSIVPSTNTAGFTPNENKLNELEIKGVSMRDLTDRYVSTYQFGYNGSVTSTSSSSPTYQDMRGVNGVPHDAEVGIPIHHDGWIIGASVSCKKSGGTSSRGYVGLYIYRNGITNSGGTVWAEDTYLTPSLSVGDGIISRATDTNNHSSGNAGHQVFAGDFLRVKLYVRGYGNDSFAVNSIGGAITIYHEI